MTLKLFLSLIAAILAIIGNVPYLYDSITKKIQPHPYTWFVWSIVSCITFFGQLQKGGGYAVIATGVAEMFTILIFISSLRNGFKNVRRVDTVFLIISILGIIPWYLTRDPTISVIIAVCIDLVAFLPALRKAWHYPKSENSILYLMNIARHILVLVSINTYNIATALHSISMICTNSAMISVLRYRLKQSNKT